MYKLKIIPLEERIVLDATLFVDIAAKGNDDGSSWSNAYNHLQDALDFAKTNPGPEAIWIAKGTYLPTKDAAGLPNANSNLLTFTVPGDVTIYGGFKGVESSIAQRKANDFETILSGDILGNDVGNRSNPHYLDLKSDNSLHVVTIANGATVVLDGFTITEGYAHSNTVATPLNSVGAGIFANGVALTNLTLNNMKITDHNALRDVPNLTLGFGAGLYQRNGSLTITNSEFSGNVASFRGGALNAGVNIDTNATVVMDNLLIQNSLFYNNSSSIGGAISSRARGYDISHNFFRDNSSSNPAGALFINYRTGVSALNRALISDNVFERNGGGTLGGAIEQINSAPLKPVPVLQDNVFIANKAILGGAVASLGNYIYERNTFIGNEAIVGGGALFSEGVILVKDSLFVDNSLRDGDITALLRGQASVGQLYSPSVLLGGGAIMGDDGGALTVQHSTFIGNTAPFGGAISVPGYAYYLGPAWNYDNGLPNFNNYALHPSAPASLSLSDSYFFNNRATAGSGGAIWAGAVTFPATPFAGGIFPAITVFGPTTLTITGNSFFNNRASDTGGGIAGLSTTLNITNNDFLNDHSHEGDEISIISSTVNTFSTTTQSSNVLNSLLPPNNFGLVSDELEIA